MKINLNWKNNWTPKQTFLEHSRNQNITFPERLTGSMFNTKMPLLMNTEVSKSFKPFMTSIFRAPFCCYDLQHIHFLIYYFNIFFKNIFLPAFFHKVSSCVNVTTLFPRTFPETNPILQQYISC